MCAASSSSYTSTPSQRSTCGTRLSAKIGQAIEVGELGHTGEREVIGDDLSTLVEAAIVEHRHAACEHFGEPHSGAACFLHQVERPTRVARGSGWPGRGAGGGAAEKTVPSVRRRAKETPQRAQGLCIKAHQLVVRTLAEDRRDLNRAHAAKATRRWVGRARARGLRAPTTL